MKINLKKRIITIAVVFIITLGMGAGSVHAGDNGDGTITNNPFFIWQKQLVWLKNANCFGKRTQDSARQDAAALRSGMCGLTDNSTAGQWRLPTKEELIGRMQNKTGFINVQGDHYWSSTAVPPYKYWSISSYDGDARPDYTTSLYFVWLVRD